MGVEQIFGGGGRLGSCVGGLAASSMMDGLVCGGISLVFYSELKPASQCACDV